MKTKHDCMIYIDGTDKAPDPERLAAIKVIAEGLVALARAIQPAPITIQNCTLYAGDSPELVARKVRRK